MIRITVAAPAVVQWLAHDRPVRVLHQNAEMVTLADEAGEVCSLVSETRGLGPFAGVVSSREWGRGKWEPAGGRGEVWDGVLWIGGVGFTAGGAVPWDPRVRWRGVPRLDGSAEGPERLDQSLVESAMALTGAVESSSWEVARAAVHYLAGRGPGLTPLGDDVILGVFLALHARGHAWAASAEGLAEVVAARTTTLSAAWVRAAARGEAAIAWHQLAHARSPGVAAAAIRSIRRWGSSSGQAAWAAFAATAREDGYRVPGTGY